MSKSRVQREQYIAEAEGYLDLLVACTTPCQLKWQHREMLAEKALSILVLLDENVGRRSHILFLIGQAHRLCGRYEDAVSALESALDYDDSNIGIYLSLGWCYKRLGNLPAAISSLEDALLVEPNSGIVNYNLACYLALSDDAVSASQFLTVAFDHDPRFRDIVSEEPDFDHIRNHPAFLAVFTAVV